MHPRELSAGASGVARIRGMADGRTAQGANGAPVFRRRVQVTHPFKGLLPPTGTILQVWPAIEVAL
jgi:hypothetical protein